MPLIAKSLKIVQEKAHLGLHDAILAFVVDIGTHINHTKWGDKAQHQIVFGWEIDQLMTEGEYVGLPILIPERYTFSLYKNSILSQMLESWFAKKISPEKREQGIDLEALIGRRSTLNLVESADGRYINIASVNPAGKDNKLAVMRKEIPNWLIKLQETSIEKSKEGNASEDQSMEDNFAPQDDLPF
jgi:hypothetical protein